MLELEIEAIVFFPDSNAFLLGTVLENQLLQEQECSLMIDNLTYLHLWLPVMRRICLLAILTLQILHDKLHHKSLLQHSATHDFLLYSKLNLESPRMRLCPNEACINHFHPFQTFDMLQTQGKELWRFQFTSGPWWSLITITLSAMLQLNSFRDTFSYVDLWFQTLHASIWAVRRHHSTT